MTTKGTPLNGIGYVRVSKVGGRGDELLSPEIQEKAITDYARSHGIRIVKWVTDLDRTGRTFDRRQVGAIIADIERGEASVIVVWKWSRWARDTAEGLSFLGKVIKAGGNVRAATEDFDTSTGVGEFSRDMMLALATLQSRQIGEGWKETQATRRGRGLPHTANPRFGYTYDRATGYVVDGTKRDLLVDTYTRFANGTPMRALVLEWNTANVKTCAGNEWKPTSLGRMLDTGFAAGLIRERTNPPTAAENNSTIGDFDIWREGAHEPIISRDVWDAYKARRESNAAKPRRTVNATHALSGLVVCATCDRRMSSSFSGVHKRHAWVCTTASLTRDHVMSTGSNKKLEALVLRWVTDHATGGEQTEAVARQRDAARGRARANVETLTARRDELVATRKRIARQVGAGRITDEDADELLAEVAEDMERVEAELRAAQETAAAAKPQPIIFDGIIAAWNDSTPQGRALLIRPLIRQITVRPGGWADPRKAEIVPRWAV